MYGLCARLSECIHFACDECRSCVVESGIDTVGVLALANNCKQRMDSLLPPLVEVGLCSE